MMGPSLSHYEICGRLGAGGMGEVYLARDTNLDRVVALKILPGEREHAAAKRGALRRSTRSAPARHPTRGWLMTTLRLQRQRRMACHP
jgi:serine/threonine protein kinase